MYTDFTDKVYAFYKQNRRDMPWRNLEVYGLKDRGYRVIVSEVMLQQTQVNRVTQKYTQWIQAWPTIDDFNIAMLADVLVLWTGLGYNRRAKYLYHALKTLHEQYEGVVPSSIQQLTTLPGIGKNTAGAILAYTYNQPVVFIETNIRTVYLHEFYANSLEVVSDTQLLKKVTETMDTQNPREWYYALMDYGAFIKKNHGTSLHKSASYKKQSAFHGSNRQVRGKVLAILASVTTITKQDLYAQIADEKLDDVLVALLKEELIIKTNDGFFSLPGY